MHALEFDFTTKDIAILCLEQSHNLPSCTLLNPLVNCDKALRHHTLPVIFCKRDWYYYKKERGDLYLLQETRDWCYVPILFSLAIKL